MLNEEMMKKIVSEVVAQLSEEKPVKAAAAAPVSASDEFVPDVSVGEHVDTYNVVNPANPAYKTFKRNSPGRLGIGNAGPRYLTRSALRFEADFATAVDAFRYELPKEFLQPSGETPETYWECNEKRFLEEFENNPEKSGRDKIKETLLGQAQKLPLSSVGNGKSSLSITVM